MPTVADAIPAVMDAGSTLICIVSTHYGGGATSRPVHTGLTVAYDLGNVKFEENHLLSLPIEAFQQLPDPIQRMLGQDAGDNFMGYVELDGRMSNPHQLLATPERILARRPATTALNR